jgi:glycosyltransferase involved in cell wall biosynthesis
VGLSVVVLTQDVEALIHDCLESVKWADEIVVVDGGSRDRTLSICREFTDRIIERSWPGVSNLQWIAGIEAARGPWVLLLSSDMRVQPEGQAELQTAMTSEAHHGYSIPLKNHFLDRWIEHCGWWPDYQLLLFRKDRGSMEPREHGLVTVRGHVGTLRVPIVHYAHRRISDYVRKTNRYTDAEVRDWVMRPVAFRPRFLVTKMVKNFKKTYWKQQGYLDGMHGLVFCGLMAFYKFLLYAKYWERRQPNPSVNPQGARLLPGQTRLAQVSAVVLTKDEEARISRCLESLSWANEIVVVDGESCDRTAAIAAQYGARVIPHAFSGSFAQERNFGAEQAVGEWILQLDADDVVTEQFRRRVEGLLAHPQSFDAYKFQRRSVLLGRPMRYGGWRYYIPNFYRKGRAQFIGLVHERLQGVERVGVLEAPVDHYAIEELSGYIDKQNRYTTLSAKELFETRGVIPLREVRYHLTRKPLKIFWKSCVKKQGFREGVYGLLLAVLFAWVHFLTWAKYWELAYVSSARVARHDSECRADQSIKSK